MFDETNEAEGYTELPPYLNTGGKEKILHVLDSRNAIGCAVGILGGKVLGNLVFGDGLDMLLFVLCWLVLCVGVTIEYHGILLWRRAWLAWGFVWHWITGGQRLDGLRWVDAELAEAVIRTPQLVLGSPDLVWHNGDAA
jgi:hypothetical protein